MAAAFGGQAGALSFLLSRPPSLILPSSEPLAPPLSPPLAPLASAASSTSVTPRTASAMSRTAAPALPDRLASLKVWPSFAAWLAALRSKGIR